MRPRTDCDGDGDGDRPRATFIDFPPDSMFVFILLRLIQAVFEMLPVACTVGGLFPFVGHLGVYLPGPDASGDQVHRGHG